MTLRSNLSQGIHDRVINTAYNNLDKIGFDIYINPGQSKNTSIGNQYPDIIITDKGSDRAKWIIEVETLETITKNEALTQWYEYSKLGGIFYLLVPKNYRNIAELICVQNNIKARFGTYEFDKFNNIIISYE
jgi:hypothetical protein